MPFLKSAGGQVLQTSYPPGLTVLAYLHFLISGGCGDRLVQLIVVFAVAALCYAVLRDSTDRWCALPVVVYCLLPVVIRMASGFYAEPFTALALVSGRMLARRGRGAWGALVMGSAGLFRPEAGLVAFVFVLSEILSGKSLGTVIRLLALSAMPSLSWFAICRCLGFGTLRDWDLGSIPDFGRMVDALRCETVALLSVVAPVAAMLCIVRGSAVFRPHGCVWKTLVPAGMFLLLIPFACGFYSSPGVVWMAENTLPRLVWYVFSIPLYAAVARRWECSGCCEIVPVCWVRYYK